MSGFLRPFGGDDGEVAGDAATDDDGADDDATDDDGADDDATDDDLDDPDGEEAWVVELLESAGGSDDATGGDVGAAWDDLVAATGELEPGELKEMFPARDIAVEVAERVDDLAPDIERADAEAIARALAVVREGLDQCAVLKQLAGNGVFAPVTRELRTEIRAEKKAILYLRRDLERRRDELQKEAEAWERAGVERPTGFAAWGLTPADAAAAAKRAEERSALVRETHDYVLRLGRETHRKGVEARERAAEQYRRALSGRYY